MRPDFFISHASEDKSEVARPLAVELRKYGFAVWFDEFELNVGDPLTEKINAGLAQSRFGIVILSESFFRKRWPQEELGALMARSVNSGRKIILPVWHNISESHLLEHAPMLADKFATSTTWGIARVARSIVKALPGADDRTIRSLVGRWRDPADSDTLYVFDHGREIGGIYDLARNRPTGTLRGVVLEDRLYYRWKWIDASMQGAGRLSIDVDAGAAVGQWWHHETPDEPRHLRYEFIDGTCPRWLTPIQIKTLTHRLFYT